jgi:hypothetical protein
MLHPGGSVRLFCSHLQQLKDLDPCREVEARLQAGQTVCRMAAAPCVAFCLSTSYMGNVKLCNNKMSCNERNAKKE